MKAKKIEAEGSELILRNEHGDYAIIPKKHRREVSDMVKENCHRCIDNFVETLPVMESYAQDGSLLPSWDKIKSTLNPYNLAVSDYTDKYSNKDKAFAAARKAGEKEYLYKGVRYTTDYAGTPQQQLNETGTTNNEIKQINTANTAHALFGNVGKYFFDINDKDIQESPYKPSINSSKKYYTYNKHTKKREEYIPEEKYYTRAGMKNDVFKDLTSENVKKQYNHTEEFDDIYNALKSNGFDRKHDANNAFPKNKAGYKGIYNVGHGSFKGQINFGRYIVDAGEDENGRYISFYDDYDWNGLESHQKYPEYNEKKISFYDRIYENEWHRLQNKKYSDKELLKLDINKKNFDVLSLQKALFDKGYKLTKSIKADGSFDGILGKETKAALLDYKKMIHNNY